MPKNQLYYGDNLDILRRYVDDESVDLVYLDPPFKSNHDYGQRLDFERSAALAKAKPPKKGKMAKAQPERVSKRRKKTG